METIFKVGDTVLDTEDGNTGVVISINNGVDYPIIVDFGLTVPTIYTADGRYTTEDKPTLVLGDKMPPTALEIAMEALELISGSRTLTDSREYAYQALEKINALQNNA